MTNTFDRPEKPHLQEFAIVGVVERTTGINAGAPAAREVPGGSCWHCGTSIRVCVQARNLETGEVVDIGTTCAERIGLDRKALREYLAERFAQERLERTKAYREARLAEHERLEAEAESRLGAHGTETRYLGGCDAHGGFSICLECRMAAPHGTVDRFYAQQCACRSCVDTVLASDQGLCVTERAVLVDLREGAVVDAARMVSGQYGTSWWMPGGVYVPAFRKRRETIARRGYTYARASFIVRCARQMNEALHVIRRISTPTVDDWGEPIATIDLAAPGGRDGH